MKKEQLVRKLTSRKLWTATASFVSMMVVATGGSENTATQVTALIMAGASVIGYIIGEGLTDAANTGAGIEDAVALEDVATLGVSGEDTHGSTYGGICEGTYGGIREGTYGGICEGTYGGIREGTYGGICEGTYGGRNEGGVV